MKTPLFITILILVVFGFALYIYFAFLNKPKVPQEFFTAYEANDTMTKAMLAKTIFDLPSFGNAYQAKDYPKALQLVTIAAIQNERNTKKFITVSQNSVQLKIRASDIEDASVKEQADKIFSALDDKNANIQKLLSLQKQFFTQMQTYFEGILLQGQKEQQLNIDAVLQTMQVESNDIAQAQFQLDQLYDEFKKLAEKNEQAGFIPPTSFQAPPDEEIVVTEIPVVTPTVEVVAPAATESAKDASGSSLPK